MRARGFAGEQSQPGALTKIGTGPIRTCPDFLLSRLSSLAGPLLLEILAGQLQGLDELLSVPEELCDALVKVASDLVDGNEEGHLALAQRVEDLTVVLCNPEDALSIGDQLDPRKVLLQPGLLAKVLVGPADPLEGHPAIEESLHYLESHQVPKGVQAAYSGAASGRLNARTNQSDLVPITELMAGTPRKSTCLKNAETLQRWPLPKKLETSSVLIWIGNRRSCSST